MKLRASGNWNAGLTLTDLLVLLAIVAIFAVIGLDIPDRDMAVRARRINCVNNLKEVGLAYKIWRSDHKEQFPFEISVTNGGTMELAQNGDVVSTFQMMSNQLATPKILYCTANVDLFYAQNFSSGFCATNISYFIGVDADANAPKSVLSGDDNLELRGVPAKSGLFAIPESPGIGWTSERHKFAGNILFSDGSVYQLTSSGLATNFTNSITRLAIP